MDAANSWSPCFLLTGVSARDMRIGKPVYNAQQEATNQPLILGGAEIAGADRARAGCAKTSRQFGLLHRLVLKEN
jgi:hypothetical protein